MKFRFIEQTEGMAGATSPYTGEALVRYKPFRQIQVCLTGIVGAAICRPRATYSRPYDILIKLPAKFKFI